MHELSLLNDIALSIIFATLSAHFLKMAKQPLILAYVLGGIILGPSIGFGIIHSEHNIELISEIGLIFLLFIIGLEINIKHILNLGKNIIILSLSQFLIGCLIAFLIFKFALFLGLKNTFDIIYACVALNLSSTLIVVKLLKDKFETDTLAGQITIGILILQDIFAIIFMAFQPNFSNPQVSKLVYSFGLGVLLVIGSFAFSKYILSQLFKTSSKTPEIVLLTSIAWCFLISALADKIGLSKEMGALIAGVSISSFPYSNDVITKISGIRDFFVTLFFVSLGLKFPVPDRNILFFSGFAVLIVIATRIVSIVPFAKILRIGARPLSIASINLSQISEFSLVILALGFSYGHISKNLQMQILTSMLLTSLISTYLITYSDRIYNFAVKMLSIKPEKEKASKEENEQDIRDIIILGYFKEARELIDMMIEKFPHLKERICVVDFNTANKFTLEKKGVKWIYGDLSNIEALKHVGLIKPNLVISSISDIFLKGTTNKNIFLNIKKIFPRSKVILIAENEKSRQELIEKGAFKALIPHKIVAEEILKEISDDI